MTGWQPIDTVASGTRCVGKFNPMLGGRTVYAIGDVRGGIFRNHLGDWLAIKRVLPIPFEDVDIPRGDRDGVVGSFQSQVAPWLLACFGPEIAGDREERNHRFLEEALELVQACGCTASEAHQLVDYVFGRPIGEPRQEAGGVMVTLAALCLANALDMHEAGWTELQRIWTKVEQIRAKQAAKPKHSPLPEAPR